MAKSQPAMVRSTTNRYDPRKTHRIEMFSESRGDQQDIPTPSSMDTKGRWQRRRSVPKLRSNFSRASSLNCATKRGNIQKVTLRVLLLTWILYWILLPRRTHPHLNTHTHLTLHWHPQRLKNMELDHPQLENYRGTETWRCWCMFHLFRGG